MPQTTKRKLGATQADVLRTLIDHRYWHAGGCGWVWTTERNTQRILDSLVKRGLVRVDDVTINGRRCYLPE